MLLEQDSQPSWNYGEILGGPAASPECCHPSLENTPTLFPLKKKKKKEQFQSGLLFVGYFSVLSTVFPINMELPWFVLHFISSHREQQRNCPKPCSSPRVLGSEGLRQGVLKAPG